MTHELRDGGYTASDDASRIDVDYVHAFLTAAYWSPGISREVVARGIENSIAFGVYDTSGKQCGFARAITDRATFAYIADVFVDERERGKGLGKLLMRAIMSHTELQGLRRWMLGTRDAHGLYAQVGFEALVRSDRMMEMLDENVYKGELSG